MQSEAPFFEEDLKILALASKALHRDDPHAPNRLFDTLAALTTLQISPESRFNRGILALRQYLKTASPSKTLEGLYQPFWNLGPDQRLALALLHIGRSSWSRVVQALGLPASENLGAFFWSARQELVYRSGVNEPVPAGPTHPGADCPPYESDNPWSQKFFDEELLTPDRVFIERHLQTCTSCSEHLGRLRAFYYKADKAVRDAIDVDALSIPSLKVLIPNSSRQGIDTLLKRWDVWAAIAGFLVLLTRC